MPKGRGVLSHCRGDAGQRGYSLSKENTPFGTPRDNEGTPLDPALSVPARNHCTRCAKNCLRFPVAAFDLVCVYVRSAAAAAGLRKASAFGDTAFLREKAVRKRARGRPPQPRHRKPDNRPTARAAQRSACSFLLRLSIWAASCGRCRSAVGLRGVILRRLLKRSEFLRAFSQAHPARDGRAQPPRPMPA